MDELNSTPNATAMPLKPPNVLKQYMIGFNYMLKGFKYAKDNPGYIGLLIVPFLISIAIYGLSFYLFTIYSTDLVEYIFPKPENILILILWYLTVAVAYIIILTIMLFTFMVLTNILCSPFYDLISQKLERSLSGKAFSDDLNLAGQLKKGLLLIKEEIKKALFVAILPALMLLIPVIGVFLAGILGALFIAWEYLDYSLSRHEIHLKNRLTFIFRHKFYLLGFGTPLMIPILNLFLFPLAIMGATLLYFEQIHSSLKGSLNNA